LDFFFKPGLQLSEGDEFAGLAQKGELLGANVI
jgi:hypothetical protein